MKRRIAVCVLAAGVSATAPAAAEPLELGAWLGPRVYSHNSTLGSGGELSDELTSALAVGGRVGLPLLRGKLWPELELALSPTQSDRYEVGVLWLEPRASLRYLFRTDSWLEPFVVVGGGAPVVISGNTRVIAHDVLGEGFIGGGATLWPNRSFGLRVDGRLSFGPGSDPAVAVELEIGVGVAIPLGRARRVGAGTVAFAAADRDGDKISDGKDACADRPEDADGFEDEDGCPDIDNDLDRVLDAADKCVLQAEAYNGFEDADGCPDAVPPEVAALVGALTALEYRAGERVPARTAQQTGTLDRVANVLIANPSVRIVLIGHTDDREAAALATEELEPDLAQLSFDLGRQRVEALRDLLVLRGVDEARVLIESRGSEEPLQDNDTPAGQRRNRRAELRLYIVDR